MPFCMNFGQVHRSDSHIVLENHSLLSDIGRNLHENKETYNVNCVDYSTH
jgi:hypothetical protein